jgi:hypothetical protein
MERRKVYAKGEEDTKLDGSTGIYQHIAEVRKHITFFRKRALRIWLSVKLRLFKSSVPDVHPLHADADPAQKLNANPEPGRRANADLCRPETPGLSVTTFW